MVKHLSVNRLDAIIRPSEVPTPNVLDMVPWPAFPYQPEVSFYITHDDKHIYLKYIVHEKSIKATTIDHNGPVWKDSCVEFFVSPAEDGIYYNFEFNCIGAIRLSSGTSRHGRTLAEATILEQIKIVSSLEKVSFEEKPSNQPWELSICIPVACFFEHQIDRLGGEEFRANFYKCGDDLSTPHYLAWNPIETPQPDFHTPQFFGRISFE